VVPPVEARITTPACPVGGGKLGRLGICSGGISSCAYTSVISSIEVKIRSRNAVANLYLFLNFFGLLNNLWGFAAPIQNILNVSCI
jgi:hypothetical protein